MQITQNTLHTVFYHVCQYNIKRQSSAFISWFCNKMQKKKSSKVVSQPAVEGTGYQLPAVRQSDTPITPPVSCIVSVLVRNILQKCR